MNFRICPYCEKPVDDEGGPQDPCEPCEIAMEKRAAARVEAFERHLDHLERQWSERRR